MPFIIDLMKNICPICQRELSRVSDETQIESIYGCTNRPKDSITDHYYGYKILGDELISSKVRIGNLVIQILYREGISKVWTFGAEESKKVKINFILEPDFSDLEKIKRKIRTLLTFS